MYATLADGYEDTDDDTTTVMVMQTAAAATMGSTLGGTYNVTLVPSKVAITINQLSANQTALLQKMAAMMLYAPPLIPPIRALAMPGISRGPPFFVGGGYNQSCFNQGGGFNQRHSRCNSGHWGHVCGYGWGSQSRKPFADLMAARGGSGAFQGGVPGGHGIPQFQQAGGFPQRNNLSHSNVVEKFTIWNACYTCGFGIKVGHMSATCPGHWHKPTHVEAFTCADAQQYINQGYGACTKGMHKTTFPEADF
jgi:hypothetical protein